MTATDPPPCNTLILEEFLPYRVNVLANLLSKGLARVYAERWDISIPDWRVLVTLAASGAKTQKEIGAHTHLDKTKMSRAVAHLEVRGLIVRHPNSQDKREAFLTLTEEGRVVFAKIVPLAIEFNTRMSARLDAEQRRAFDITLQILTETAAELSSEIDHD